MFESLFQLSAAYIRLSRLTEFYARVVWLLLAFVIKGRFGFTKAPIKTIEYST
jgi:hypothetical protein